MNEAGALRIEALGSLIWLPQMRGQQKKPATVTMAADITAPALKTTQDEADRFSVVATMLVDGRETIVGEARYAFHSDTASIEFGLSIDDRWQGHGIGKALMKNLECRAASFGARRLFGDTLRSNDAMIALARKAGYAFTNTPGDWKLTRFQKEIPVEPQEIPCASWRLAAVSPSAMSSLAV